MVEKLDRMARHKGRVRRQTLYLLHSLPYPTMASSASSAFHDRALLLSAIPYVLDDFGTFCDLYDDKIRLSTGDFTCTLWWFVWDFAIQKGDKQIFIRDVVNLPEFRQQLSEAESKRHSRFVTVHSLERQTKVGEDGVVLYDHAILNATYSHDGPCDECGKMSKNGRATCLCPFDKDDLNKMDIMLGR